MLSILTADETSFKNKGLLTKLIAAISARATKDFGLTHLIAEVPNNKLELDIFAQAGFKNENKARNYTSNGYSAMVKSI